MEAHRSLLLLLVLGVLCVEGNVLETKIIGGHEAAPHSHSYMASLQKARSHLCGWGGEILVHPWWVLTVAHHLAKLIQRLKLVLGLHDLHDSCDPGLTFHIKAALQHPGYNLKLENGLMLLKLDRQVQPSSTIWPLDMPKKCHVVPVGTQCSIAGWGQTHQGGRLAQVLQELDLHMLDTRMCNNSRFWNGTVTGHMLCLAADAMGQVPCKGDSGSPLMCGRNQVDGILSFSSKTCTDVFKPPVATAMSPYMFWIRKVIRP